MIEQRSLLKRLLLVVGCFAYSQLVIGVDSIGRSTGRYDRVIMLEQLVWLTPLGVLLFFWTFGEFRRCDVHPYRILLAVALILILAMVAWPLRQFGSIWF